ncbi:thyroid hormone receptor-associated protein 3b isoform 2-T2 [Fundulus diaphanus]
MSKAMDSPSRPRSRSRSRSRSYSRSRSRSNSRSRSRKRHYRSRSRSHSPGYRNYPSRDYQGNNRGFRGYNRGYRRPYHYRGRSRGYYPRGHYQNRGRGGGGGGGGGGGYGYKSNWQGGGGGWHDRQEHRSPRRAYSRSRTPKKRSPSRSRSRNSDRSSSGRSQHSRHSSYSSRSRSRSSSRNRDSKGRPRSKDAKDKQPESQIEKPAPPADGVIAKATGGKWIEYDTSPKRRSPDSKKEDPASPGSKGSGGSGGGSGGGTLWKTVGSVSPPAKSPSKSGQTASFGGFGFFSKEEAKAGDSAVISAAFKKFMAENKHKKQAAEKENSREKEQGSAEPEKSSKSSDLFTISASPYAESKEDKVPFFDPGEEEFLESQGLKERIINEDAEGKPGLTERDIFGKWGDEPSYSSSYQTAKEKGRRDEDEEDAVDDVEEELYRSRKHSSKKEEKSKKKEKKEKAKRSLTPPSTSKEKERPLFPGAFPALDPCPPHRLSASRAEFELKMSSLEEMPSSSLSKDRLAPRDLLHSSKKDPEFRSIFQHMQSVQLRRSPSELFAQHIVSIVHYIKAQHFPSSDMTLSERFALYERKAAEAEMMKPRKSPEIHRRIDVSPSAFKRHSQLFEDLDETSYKDPSKRFKGDIMDLRLDIERRKRFAGKERDYKREGGKSPEGSRGASREQSSEKSGKHHKKSKKSKKKRDRSPSSSSSSSSPSPYPPLYRGKEFMGEGMEPLEEGYSHSRYPPRDYSASGDRGPRDHEGHFPERGRGRGFFPRIRGRGWNRGNYPGNSNGNPANMNPPVRPQEEDWDPEYTPKSRKYYLHDDRDGEKTWVESRGRGRGSFPARRGRFVYRKGGSSPKWTHDMFQGAEEGELGDDGMEVEHKESKTCADGTSKQ